MADKTSALKKPTDYHSIALSIIAISVIVLLISPIIILIATSFNPGDYIAFPPQGFSLRHYLVLFTEGRWRSSFQASIIIAIPATIVSITTGTLAAYAMVKIRFKLKDLVYFAILSPELFPGAIIGIGLLMSLASFRLQGTYYGFIIAHSIFASPLVFLVMVGVLKDIDPTLTEAAIDLGATPIRSFFEITLPLAKSGILSGTLLAFIVSFNEFTISYFIMSYRTVTLPIIIWTSLRYGVSPTVAAVSVIMLIIVAISLGAIAKLVGIEKISIK